MGPRLQFRRSSRGEYNKLVAEIAPRTSGLLADDRQTTEDFSFHIWRQIFASIVRNEKKALEDFSTVRFEIEVNERRSDAREVVPILKIELICEPGKPARPVCDEA